MSIISDIHSINIVYVGFNDMGIHNLLWGILELGLNCRVYDIEHCTSDSPEDYEKAAKLKARECSLTEKIDKLNSECKKVEKEVNKYFKKSS